MRGNIGDHRFVDLAVIVALLTIVVGGYCYCSIMPVEHTATALIIPGQATRW